MYKLLTSLDFRYYPGIKKKKGRRKLILNRLTLAQTYGIGSYVKSQRSQTEFLAQNIDAPLSLFVIVVLFSFFFLVCLSLVFVVVVVVL